MSLMRLTRLIARMTPVRPVQLAGAGPIASITFDDFPKSAWTVGGPILARRNVRGTYYTAGGFCGRTLDGTEFYDAADLTELAAAGHEIGCHGFGHQPTPTLSTAELEEDAARNARFLAPFLNGGAAQSYAYPYGALSLRTKRLYSRRFSNVRGVHPGLNEGRAEMAQLNAIGIESRNWDHAAAMHAIERARQTNAWIIFYTHDVCDTPGPYGATPAMLADVLDGLIAAGIPMLPMREAMPVALGQAVRSAA